MKYPWLEIAQQIQSIAQAGLTFCENKYDIERYQQLQKMAGQIMADFTDTEMEKVEQLFLNQTGYQTPKVDVRGVVFRDNKILLVRETIDNCWSLPGGWADVGHTPREVVEKEVQEEAGLEVQAERIVAVLDKKCHPHPPSPFYVYKIFFLCKEVGGTLGGGMETSDVQFFELKQLPELSAERNTISQIQLMFDFLKNPDKEIVFD